MYVTISTVSVTSERGADVDAERRPRGRTKHIDLPFAIAAGMAAAGVVVGLLAYRIQVDDLGSPRDRALAVVAVGWAFLAAGLVATMRRPENRLGLLLSTAGLLLLARQLRYSEDPVLFTMFFAFGGLAYAVVAHSALAYPSGRLRSRPERLLAVAGYAAALAFPVAILLFYDGSVRLQEIAVPRESLIMLAGEGGLVHALDRTFVVVFYGVLACLFIALIAWRLAVASPRERRILAPLLVAAVAIALRAVFESVLTFTEPRLTAGVLESLFWWQIAAFAALPLALLAGLLRARLARASIGDLVVELDGTPPAGIRAALARALGDPTLELGFWLPERGVFVDAAGRPLPVPENRTRSVTRLEHDGEPYAVLVHDPSLNDEPKLVESASAAARLALENARLHAQVQAQLALVTESRARIVAAADEERRRIEGDLHDGAQQRLVALALELRRAQRRHGELDPDLAGVLASTVEGLQLSVEELRELALGIHPPVLTQQGLVAALEELAGRSPIPVTVDAAEIDRLPPAVEATAYFVACEGIANVTKHAAATCASLIVRQTDRTLVLEVVDDGTGGASSGAGSGLRNLADRVEGVGGRLSVESPSGGGTRLVAEIPCES
jgi:signal transduction histidine kinase